MGGDVSIIVPTYNRAAVLGQTIDSLLRQTVPASQIIVVDDGSTDGTPEVVARYCSQVQYLHRPNGGKPAALNTALPLVTGTYTWIVDDDDVACADAVERFAAALMDHPQCAFSYGTYYATRPTTLESGVMGDVIGESGVPDLALTGLLVALLEGNFLGGARIFVRTECYRSVGGFDVRFHRSEDYEMPIRLARRWPAARAKGGPMYMYREHTGSRGHAADRFEVQENLAKFYSYDSMLFNELLESMSIAEFLPPGTDPRSSLRQAHLQRLSLSVIHRVETRLGEMLDRIAEECGSTAYGAEERAVLDRLVARIPGLWTPSSLSLVTRIRERSQASAVARLRTELARAALRRRLTPPISARALAGTARRAASMYTRAAG